MWCLLPKSVCEMAGKLNSDNFNKYILRASYGPGVHFNHLDTISTGVCVGDINNQNSK